MATITPATTPKFNADFILWETAATGDTITPYQTSGSRPLAGAVQVVGTFGGATVTLEESIDGTNFAGVKDLQGTAISFTAAGIAQFTSACGYFRIAISGGTGDDVDAHMTLRG